MAKPPPTPPTTPLLPGGQKTATNRGYLALLSSNYLALFVGSVGSSLVAKFYFNHGGSSRWVLTLVQTAGFPSLLVPILLPSYLRLTARKPFAGLTRRLLILSIIVGLFLGVNDLLFSWGVSYLPVSTSSLVLSMQLAFTLILSALIVKQKITFLNLNCVILLSLSSVLVAISSSHDLPAGLTTTNYFVGFLCTIGSGLLFALYLPVMEKIYREVNCYEMVMEMQFIMEAAATALAVAGMAATGGFAEMRKEYERGFDLGPRWYVVTVVGNVVAWQLCFMSTAGMVFLTTSLTSGVCMAALMAVNVLAGVAVFGDSFGGAKAVATLLCLWGFSSYVYGMYVKMKGEKAEVSKGGGEGRLKEMAPPFEMAAKVVDMDVP